MTYIQPTRPVAGTIATTEWGTQVADDIAYLKTELDKSAMHLIEKITLTEAGTIEFTDIPDTYTHLKLVVNARGTYASYGDSLAGLLNSDTDANYDGMVYALVNGTEQMSEWNAEDKLLLGNVVSANATENYTGQTLIYIPSYKATVFNKCVHCEYVRLPYSNSTTYSFIGRSANLWKSTSAITNIVLYGLISTNLAAGSTASLYGLL